MQQLHLACCFSPLDSLVYKFITPIFQIRENIYNEIEHSLIPKCPFSNYEIQ